MVKVTHSLISITPPCPWSPSSIISPLSVLLLWRDAWSYFLTFLPLAMVMGSISSSLEHFMLWSLKPITRCPCPRNTSCSTLLWVARRVAWGGSRDRCTTWSSFPLYPIAWGDVGCNTNCSMNVGSSNATGGEGISLGQPVRSKTNVWIIILFDLN